MENIQKISLDIMDHHPYEYIYAKQYDSGRIINFYIKEDGEDYDISNVEAYFQLKISDREFVQTILKHEDGYLSLELNNSATINSGSFDFQIELRENDSIIKTVNGKARIEKSVVSTDDIISEKYPEVVVLLDSNGKIPNSQINNASTTTAGIVALTDSVESDSITTAATPNSVKTTYDAVLESDSTIVTIADIDALF